MSSLWDRIRRRKVVQWALAYLAGGWLVLQIVDVLAQNLGWQAWVFRVTIALLSVGFLAALVLAWYHGERGRQRVSGMEVLMLAGILVIAGASVALVRTEADPTSGTSAVSSREDPAPQRPPDSSDDAVFIAVLPLKHRSRLESDRWFTEAVHDQLIGSLGRISGMRVSSRTAVLGYADTELGPTEIARKLGVDYLVEGSVQRGGARLLIASALVEAETGQQVWYRDYERAYTPEEMFDVQREIATTVANQVAVEVRPGELAESSRPATTSREAMEQVFRADLLWDEADEASLRRQIDLYREALSIDTAYAEAWARLARARTLLGGQRRIPEQLRLAEGALAKAEALAPDAPAVLAARGHVEYYVERDFEAADATLRRATTLNPSDVRLLWIRANLLRRLGRIGEAASLAEEALKLEPRSTLLLHLLLDLHAWRGEMRQARQYHTRWITVEPADDPREHHEAWLHLLEGNPSAARAALLDEVEPESIRPSAGDGLPTPLYYEGDLQGEFDLWLGWNPPQRDIDIAYRLFRLGQLSALMDRKERAAAYGDSLLAVAEPGLAETEALELGNWQWPASWWKAQLARAHALLGMPEETLRWGKRTMTEFTPKNDALDRYRLAGFLLDAYLLVDLREPAIEMLEILLSNPFGSTPALLETDPALRPILDDPEVHALLEEYESR